MSGFDLIDPPDAHVGVLPCKVAVHNVIIFNGLFQISQCRLDVRSIESLDLADQSCRLGFLQRRIEFSLGEDVLVETKFIVDVLVFGEQGQEIEVSVRVEVLHRAHLFAHLGNV